MSSPERSVHVAWKDEQTGVHVRSPQPAPRVVPLKPSARPDLGHQRAWSMALSAVAGHVDTAGFLALFGLYTAHVTGDLVTGSSTRPDRASASPGDGPPRLGVVAGRAVA